MWPTLNQHFSGKKNETKQLRSCLGTGMHVEHACKHFRVYLRKKKRRRNLDFLCAKVFRIRFFFLQIAWFQRRIQFLFFARVSVCSIMLNTARSDLFRHFARKMSADMRLGIPPTGSCKNVRQNCFFLASAWTKPEYY